MKALIFLGGFVSGALAMLSLVLWVMGDRELVDLSFENERGRYGFRGRMTEWPHG